MIEEICGQEKVQPFESCMLRWHAQFAFCFNQIGLSVKSNYLCGPQSKTFALTFSLYMADICPDGSDSIPLLNAFSDM